MNIKYTDSRAEPNKTIEKIIKTLALEDKNAKLRFNFELGDTIEVFKKNSFFFENYSFNSQFESNFTFQLLREFLDKFFLLMKASKMVENITFTISIDDVKITVDDHNKSLDITAPEFRIKLLSQAFK